MTLEIIIFISAILLGILLAYRESKNNSLYRFFNKVFNSKELQMKAENQKGFLYQQPFIMRLIWVFVGYVLISGFLWFVTPINLIYIQFFASAVVGTVIGSYLTKLFFKTSEQLSQENIVNQAKDAIDKGKEFIENLTEDETEIEDKIESKSEEVKSQENKENAAPKKSARERLKDKGMIK